MKTYKGIDLTNKKIGDLTVVCVNHSDVRKGCYWTCKCSCGNEVSVKSNYLATNRTLRCKECANKRVSQRFKTHGMSKTRLNKIYCHMKERCCNPNNKDYKHYGGRGITICQEWIDNPKKFYDWSLSNGYDASLTIERIDVNGNYEPSNCRWATRKEQANNTRRNSLYTINGETHTLSQWAEIAGKNVSTICRRIKCGWEIEEAVFGELKKNQFV